MSINFATVLMWANACFIVLLTMVAYRDALQHKIKDARKHLQMAGIIALVTAAMSSVVLREQRAEASNEAQKNSSWNAYPTTHTVSR